MRILHIIASADPRSGGPVEGILQQERGFSGSVTSELVTLDPSDAPFLKNFPLRTHTFGKSGTKRRANSIFSRYGFSLPYLNWIRENSTKYDAVIVHCLWNFATMAAALSLPRILNGKYYVYPHGMLDPWFAKQKPGKHVLKQLSWLGIEGRLLANAKAVLFTANDEKSLADGQFWGWTYNGVVIGYGVDEPPPPKASDEKEFRKILPKLGDRPYLLFLSRIHPKKGCDLLIKAFSEAARKYENLDLVIAGPDESNLVKKLTASANELGIEERIHWPGMLTGAAKWGGFRGADAFILPSHQENFGVVIAEALACGIPVLTTNKVNIWREVQDGGGGIIGTDTEEGVLNVLNSWFAMNNIQREEMRQSARRTFEGKFSIQYVARNFLDLISKNDAPHNQREDLLKKYQKEEVQTEELP